MHLLTAGTNRVCLNTCSLTYVRKDRFLHTCTRIVRYIASAFNSSACLRIDTKHYEAPFHHVQNPLQLRHMIVAMAIACNPT